MLLVEIQSYGDDQRARSDDHGSFDENLICGMRLQNSRFLMIWPILSLAMLVMAISSNSITRSRNSGVLHIRNTLNMRRNGEWFHPRWRKTRVPTLCKVMSVRLIVSVPDIGFFWHWKACDCKSFAILNYLWNVKLRNSNIPLFVYSWDSWCTEGCHIGFDWWWATKCWWFEESPTI